jgi:hypothetical protein
MEVFTIGYGGRSRADFLARHQGAEVHHLE